MDQETNQALWSKNISLFYSDDFFNTQYNLLIRGNKFILTKSFLFAAKLTFFSDNSNDVELYVLDLFDPEGKLEVETVSIPAGQYLQYGYIIIQLDDTQTFIHIKNNKIPGVNMGDLYMSDLTGHRLS